MASNPDYRTVLSRLTTLDDEAAALRAEAMEWHAGRVAAAAEAVHAAEENVRTDEAEVRAAQAKLEKVDADAAGLWSEFVHKIGARAERFGRTLPPAAVPRQQGRNAEEYLQEAAAGINYEPPARSASGGTTTVLAGIGLAGGAVGVGLRELLRWAGRQAGGDWANALPVIGLILLLLGPVLALIAARRLVPLNPTRTATILLAALLTIAVLNLLLS